MVDTQDYIGQQISEYYLQRQLGRGTFGAVYLAEHMHDQTLVAIKLLRLQLTRSLELKDFLNEARVIRLRHPHIIPILDFGISPQDTPFIVMEYAAGGTIRDRFWHGASLPLPEIVNYTTQVASALQFAHSRRLIHRDVKPENILLGADGMIRLCDFGIAKIMEQSTTMSTHAQAGTPAYMAPEQGQGEPCMASDQYALAVVVYEWLTGRRPFLGTPIEVAVQHRLNAPPPLRILRPGLPVEAEQIVLKALAKKPEERFETVAQFAQALQEAIDGSPTEKVRAISGSLPASGRPAPLPELATRALPKPTPIPPTHLPDSSGAQDESQISKPVAIEDLATIRDKAPLIQEEAEDEQTQRAAPAEPPELPGPTRLRRQIIPKRRRIFTALLAFLIVAGCALGYSAFLLSAPMSAQNKLNLYDKAVATVGVMSGFNAQHTGANPYEQTLGAATISKLKLTWKIQTGSLLASSPTVANGLLYIGTDAGQLLAFDSSTSQQKWAAHTGGITQSVPAVANGLVYIGSTDGKLYAFDALSGTLHWATPTDGAIVSSPTVANGLVYIGTENGELAAFDARSGKLKWHVYIGTENGELAASDARSGKAILTSPALANGLLYLGSSDGKLYAFDALSGTLRWATPNQYFALSSPTIADGVVYVSSQDNTVSRENRLYAFYAANGLPRWATDNVNFVYSSPAIANNLVYVSGRNGQLTAFDTSSQQQKWSEQIGGSITSAPIIANGLVYIGSQNGQNGQITVFDALTGTQVWDYATGGAIESSLTLADGVLYASSRTGELYAFSLPTT